MDKEDTQFLEFITGTLLPDMEQEGPSGTADDIKRLVGICRRLNRRGMHLRATLQDATQENASLARTIDNLQGHIKREVREW